MAALRNGGPQLPLHGENDRFSADARSHGRFTTKRFGIFTLTPATHARETKYKKLARMSVNLIQVFFSARQHIACLARYMLSLVRPSVCCTGGSVKNG